MTAAVTLINQSFHEVNAGTILHPLLVWECDVDRIGGKTGAQAILDELLTLDPLFVSDAIWETMAALRDYLADPDADPWGVEYVIEAYDQALLDAMTLNCARRNAEALTYPMFQGAMAI